MIDLAALIAGLSDPAAYPNGARNIEIRQTHISVVFLVDVFVYKVKKPVDYGFLDFGTLEKRRFYCAEEVRLNRRLAPNVYLGVVPIARCDDKLCIESDGEPMEWAVKMRRLPDDATLQYRLQHEDVSCEIMRELGRRIASFHAGAERGPHVDKFGKFDVAAGNARENFEQSSQQVGSTVSQTVFARIETLTEEALANHRLMIQARAERGVTRDTHGDLRLGHVYVFPDRSPPDNLIVIDCIEFAERFRFADPISDAAFLIMGLHLQGQRGLAREFLDAYIQTSGDEEGRMLVPFYTAYRAVVRGKVEGLKLSRPEMSDTDRSTAMLKSRASWLLALDELESPQRRPCLLLVIGLPGTGKSTLARELATQAKFEVIRTDVVRKGLWLERSACDHTSTVSQGHTAPEEMYSAEWNQRTYDECLQRAEQMLFDGKRVIVDANFRVDADRVRFLDAAQRMGVRGLVLTCEAGAEVVRERLSKRRGDASDADWSVYLKAVASWESFSTKVQAASHNVDTSGSTPEALSVALEALEQHDVV